MLPRALQATFAYANALAFGITKHRFYRFRDSGLIELLSHGLYRRADRDVADLDLLEKSGLALARKRASLPTCAPPLARSRSARQTA